MDKKYHIIYHANCLDGFTAAWVTRKALIQQLQIPESQIKTYPMAYQDKVPSEILTGDFVYIVDFSYPKELMQSLAKDTSLCWIDHHKTAIEDVGALANASGLQDITRSGAGLCWDYFFGASSRPTIIQICEDYDLWQFKYSHTKALAKYLYNKQFDFDLWNKLYYELQLVDKFEKYLTAGEELITAEQNQIDNCIKYGLHWLYIGGEVVPAFNAPPFLSSAGGDALCKRLPEAAFSVTWCYTNKNMVHLSFRSVGEFDVSVIAKSFGGGGHKNAAGAMIRPDMFQQHLMQSKE